MTAAHLDLLFVGDRCLVVAPGHRRDATSATPGSLAALVADTAGTGSSNDIGDFLAARAHGTYLNYADDTALDTDRMIMEEYLATCPPPPVEPAQVGDPIWLPHPAFPHDDDPFGRLGALLLLGFGVLAEADFLGLQTVPRKAAPSKGARHPFDAYVIVGDGWDLPPGTYSYLPSIHALARCGVGSTSGPNLVIAISVLYERVQWRYREAAGYSDLLLDLGHLRETLRLAACHLSWSLKPTALPQQLADIPLTKEVVVAWSADITAAR